jgi:type I restriction enzyme S subunit
MAGDLVPFTELLSKIVDNRGRTCPTADTGLPLIATNCIRNDRLYPTFDNVRHVSKETYDNWFRGHPEPGDLIFTCKGTPGRVCMTPDPVPFCIAQDMVAIRADPKKVHPKYLFALLRSKAVQDQIGNMHVGTLIPHFKKGDFHKLLLPVPGKKTQEFIGNTYFEMSALIELNRETNEILEEMARALFKSWFVDFDPVRAKLEGRPPAGMDAATAALFPDHFQDSELGQIPKGWEVKPLADMVEVIKGRSYRSDELAPSDTALVTLKSFLRGGGYRTDGLKPFTGEYKPSQVVKAGDLIVAFTDVTQAAEVIGKPAIVRGDEQFQTLVASLDVGIVRTKTEFVSIPFLYCLFLGGSFQAHAYAHSSGTTVLHLSKEALPSYACIVPPIEIAKKFGEIGRQIFKLLEENAAESRDLATLRDTLLPKLLSGEVSAPAAEELIAASR